MNLSLSLPRENETGSYTPQMEKYVNYLVDNFFVDDMIKTRKKDGILWT
jgi:hypothetical protein